MNYRPLKISFAENRFQTDDLERRVLTWDYLAELLTTFKRTPETEAQFKAMDSKQRGEVKDVGAVIVGGFSDNSRRAGNAISWLDCVALDFDYATSATLPKVEASGYAFALYSTHSHTEAAPRYRVIVPLKRSVTAKEYEPIARAIAYDMDIEAVDPTAYQSGRLMYLPSCSSDASPIAMIQNGEWADPDVILTERYNKWDEPSEWYCSSNENKRNFTLYHGRGGRQADPLLKGGLIGAFCRAYDIHSAIATFLPTIYIRSGYGDRYTYCESSTRDGAITYDDKFLFSHHAKDPQAGKLLNAYDLVRLHLYGHLDKRPDSKASAEAMDDLVRNDAFVTSSLIKEVFTGIEDVENEAIDKIAEVKLALQVNKEGKPFKTIANYTTVLRNDPYLNFNSVKFDLFSNTIIKTAPLPWVEMDKTTWRDEDESALIGYIQKVYDFKSETDLKHALSIHLSENTVHVVRDYIKALTWDGVARVNNLFTKYLGVAPTDLNLAMCRKTLLGCVARVFEPGIKFDTMLVLKGAQGIGKSTFIKRLGGEWASDSLYTMEGKEAVELIMGKWLIEMPEMDSFKKSEVTNIKQFLSKQEDTYRPAYGRNTITVKRQCVIFGTTNEDEILKDYTGNRRMWVVACNEERQTATPFEITEEERGQVWAEAYHLYKQGEPLFLNKEQGKALKEIQHEYLIKDPDLYRIEQFLLQPVPDAWYTWSEKKRIEWIYANKNSSYPRESYSAPLPIGFRFRHRICTAEIIRECFLVDISGDSEKYRRRANSIVRSLAEWGKQEGRAYCTAYGRQRFIYRNGIDPKEADEEAKNADLNQFNTIGYEEYPF